MPNRSQRCKNFDRLCRQLEMKILKKILAFCELITPTKNLTGIAFTLPSSNLNFRELSRPHCSRRFGVGPVKLLREIRINRRNHVQRQAAGENHSADDGDTHGHAAFGAGAQAQSDGQDAENR
jgi:hypothetical protein